MKKQYDVVIIGAGVVGSAIARELSRYKLSIAVLEKNLDVCNETSGRNSAVVHGGFANPIGSLKAKCCVEGNRIMDQLAEELNFPFKRCGKVLVGNTPEDMEQLERTMKQGAVNGCTGLEMIDEAKLHELVPAVVGKFAMWSKNSGIMDPFLYTVALAENAHANGVDFFFDHKVTAITRENELYYLKMSMNYWNLLTKQCTLLSATEETGLHLQNRFLKPHGKRLQLTHSLIFCLKIEFLWQNICLKSYV